MKINRIEAIPVCVPLKKGMTTKTAHGEHITSPYVIVRVYTDDGLVGLGEATVSQLWSGENQSTAMAVLKEILIPALIGRDPRDITSIRRAMDMVIKLNPFTRAALEMAMWDIAGKAVGLPVYNCSAERCVCGESAIRDFEALPVFAGNESLSLFVADNGFVFGVPCDLAVQASRDSGKVARRKCSMVTEHVRNGFFSIPCCFKEIAEMVHQRAILVDFLHRSIGKRVRFELINRSSGQLAPIHKDPAFGAFKENPIVAVMADLNLHSVIKRRPDKKLCGRVVS